MGARMDGGLQKWRNLRWLAEIFKKHQPLAIYNLVNKILASFSERTEEFEGEKPIIISERAPALA